MATRFRTMCVAPAALAAVVASWLAPLGARQEPTQGVELVTFDFRALSTDGEPIPDLKPGDLAFKLDGRSREIRSLQFVRAAGPADPGEDRDEPSPSSPPFGSNRMSDTGRAILLIIENESLRPDTARPALTAAGRFVTALARNDRVALLTMPRGGLLVDFTTDHARVVQALDGISGQGSSTTTATDHACRTRETLHALTSLFEGLIASEGPKTVVFVSSGLLRPTRDAPLTGPPGRCELQSKAFDDVGLAADAARIQFYSIRPEDLIVDSAVTAVLDPSSSRFRNTDEEVAGLESLTGVADGVFQRLPRGDDAAFRRVARETAGHYLLGFEADPRERNGQNHRVELRAARNDVVLRVRDRLLIAKPPTRSALTPQAMLRDGRVYRDLPVRTVAYASANPGDSKLKIIALVEPTDRSVPLAQVAFGLINAKGTLVAQWTANDRELAANPVMSAGLVAPGGYRMRTAAIDAGGRRGVAEYELVAQLVPADPLKLSAMVLGVSRGGAFQPKMHFEADPTAMGYFEIYGDPGAGALTVALEIASSDDGRALVRVPASVNVSSDRQRRTANGVVPIGALAPGDYVVRAIVSLDGRPVGKVYRTLRKGAAG